MLQSRLVLSAVLVAALACAGAFPGDPKKPTPPVAKFDAVSEALFSKVADRASAELSVDDLVELALLLSEGQFSTRNKDLAAIQAEAAKHRQEFLALALRLALDRRDPAGFDKVADAAARLGDKELLDKIALARPLLKKTRTMSKAPLIPLDEITAEGTATYKDLARRIDLARWKADVGGLKQLEEIVAAVPELHDAMREQLCKQIATAKQDLPSGDEALALLAKLAKKSRDAVPKDQMPKDQMPQPQLAATLTKENGAAFPVMSNEWAKLLPGDMLAMESPLSGRLVSGTQGSYFYQAPPPLNAPIQGGPLKLASVTENSYLMYCSGKPSALVVNGQRIQWATGAGSLFTSKAKVVTAKQYDAIPLLAKVPAGAKVIQTPGQSAAFLSIDKEPVLLPIDDLTPAVVNKSSSAKSVPAEDYGKYKLGPALKVNRWQPALAAPMPMPLPAPPPAPKGVD